MRQKEVAASDKRFYALLEHLIAGVLVHDLNLKILYSNSAAQSILGMNREQIQGRMATELAWEWIKDDGTRILAEEYPANRVLQSGKPSLNQSLGIRNPEGGEPVWIQADAFPEFDSDGKLSLVIVNLTNITREKKLLELNFLFETALDQSPAGIAIVEAPSGKLSYLNQSGFLMRGGGKPGQSVKDFDLNSLQSFWDIRRLDGVALSNNEIPLMKAIHYGEETSAELLLRGPGHADRIMWTNVAPVYRSDGTIMAGIAVFLDTTEFHVLQDQLKIAEMKSRFLDVAAHELRSPVTAFSLLLQLTQRQQAKGRPVDSSTLDRLRGQVDRISHLIDDLLEITRLQHGTIKLKFENRDLVSLISECLDDQKLRSPNRIFKFNKPIEAIQVKMDPVRIYQVLSNLLDNAIKYTGESAPIEISIEGKAQSVRVSVTDRGPGIPPELQKVLFLPFSRGTAGLAQHSGGLGLGLSICRGIIDLHGGNIGLQSEMGVGTTFYFEIPRLETR